MAHEPVIVRNMGVDSLLIFHGPLFTEAYWHEELKHIPARFYYATPLTQYFPIHKMKEV